MRLLETLLFDISSVDPVTYLLVPSSLALVAATSAWLPARRAVQVDPRSALVSE
jgi:ABC-type lipoprotein release transport system permease subunit